MTPTPFSPFPAATGLPSQELSPFETAPTDFLYHELPARMTLRQFFPISSLSRALRQNTLFAIAHSSSLLGRVFSKLIAYQEKKAVAATITALSDHKGEKEEPLSLTLDVNEFWEGTEAALESIESHFTAIPNVTLLQRRDRTVVFIPRLPASMKQLTVRSVSFVPTAEMLRNPAGLKALKVFRTRDSLRTDIFSAKDLSISLEDVSLELIFSYARQVISDVEEFEQKCETSGDGIGFSLLAVYYAFEKKDVEKAKTSIQKCLTLCPQWFLADLLHAMLVGNVLFLEQAVANKPDSALTHLALGIYFVPTEPLNALSHLMKATELALNNGDFSLAIAIASILNDGAQQLGPQGDALRDVACTICHQAFVQSEQRHHGLSMRDLEAVRAIHPTHIWANLRLAQGQNPVIRSQYFVPFLPICIEENRHEELLWILCLIDVDDEVMKNRVWDALLADATHAEMFKILKEEKFPFATSLHELLKRQIPYELPVRVMLSFYSKEGSLNVLEVFVRSELVGGPLQDLSYLFAHSKRCRGEPRYKFWRFMHRLESEARSASASLEKTASILFTRRYDIEYWWLAFLLLHKHKLAADIQIQILEAIVGDKNIPSQDSKTAVQNRLSDSGELLLSTCREPQSLYEAFETRDFLYANAHIALALLLLPRDINRAKTHLTNVLPALLALDIAPLLLRYEALFSEYNIFPEVRREILEKLLQKDRSPEVLEKLAALLMQGSHLVPSDAAQAQALLDEVQVLRGLQDLHISD